MNPDAKNPYVGPRTFREDESPRFFGRDREFRELLSLVLSERLVLFYAQSGAGKSSLLNTTLIPSLKRKGFNALPVGRVSGDAEVEVKNIYVFNLLRTLSPVNKDLTAILKQPLTDFFAELNDTDEAEKNQLEVEDEDAEYRKIFLVIDQFEEIFTTHPEAWEKREDFFRQLNLTLQDNPNLWVLLSMREDYIALLDPYTALLPGRLRTRYYMQQMEREAALDAIRKPVSTDGFSRPYAPGVAERLVDELRIVPIADSNTQQKKHFGQFVEPLILQVICFDIWANLRLPGPEITADDMQKVGDVNYFLRSYYAKRVDAVAKDRNVNERKIRKWFTDNLISITGVRKMVLHESGGLSSGLENEVIMALSDLVRQHQRGGAMFYELTHDRLVEPIMANNKEWFESEVNSSPLQRAAKLWVEEKRVNKWLLGDQALIEVIEWAKLNENEVTDTEKIFLDACQKMQEKNERQKEIERTKLEQAEAQARLTAKAQKSSRIAYSALGVALFFLILAIFSFISANRTAIQNEDLANAAEARELASQSEKNFINQLDLAILLGIEAYNKNIVNPEMEIIPQINNILYTSTERTLQMRGYLTTSSNPANKLSYSGDGKYLAVLSDDGITVWDIEDGMTDVLIPGSEDAEKYYFSPNSSRLVYFDYHGITFWDVENQEKININAINTHKGQVDQIKVGADGSTFAASGGNGNLKLWTMNLETLYSLNGTVLIAFNADGTKFATLDREGMVTVRSMLDGSQVGDLIEREADTITAMSFNSDGSVLAFADGNGSFTRIKLDNNEELPSDSSEESPVLNSFYLSPNGKYIVYESYENKVYVRDIEKHDSELVAGFGLKVSSNGSSFAVLSSDEIKGTTVNLYTSYDSLTTPATPVEGSQFEFSPDGSLLIVYRDIDEEKSLILVNPLTDDEDRVIPYNGEAPTSMALNRDGNLLAVSDVDGHVYVWDLSDPRKNPTIQKGESRIISMAFSLDGRYLLSGLADGRLAYWELEKQPVYLESGFEGKIYSVNLTPAEKYFYSTAETSTGIQFYSLEGNALGDIVPGYNPIFNEDDNIVATLDDSGQTSLWGLPEGNEIKDSISGAVVFAPMGNYAVATENVADENIAEENSTDAQETELQGTVEPESTISVPESTNGYYSQIINITTGDPIGGLIKGEFSQFRWDGKVISIRDSLAGTITLFNTQTGRHIGEPILGVDGKFSTEGTTIAVTDYINNIYLFDSSTGEKLGELNNVYFQMLSPDGDVLLASDSLTNNMIFWDVKENKQIEKDVPSGYSYYTPITSPDGNLVSWSNGSLWNFATRKNIAIPPTSNPIFSPDGEHVWLTPYNGRSYLWNLQKAKKIEFDTDVGFSRFSPDGKFILMADNSLWSIETRQQVAGQFFGHSGLATGGWFGTPQAAGIYISEGYLYLITENPSYNLSYSSEAFILSPDLTSYATLNLDGNAILWDLKAEHAATIPGEIVHEFSGERHAVSLAPDQETLAISTLGAISLWDVDENTEIHHFESPHVEELTEAILDPTGKFLVIADSIGNSSIWDIKLGNRIIPEIPSGINVFSPNGKTIATEVRNSSFILFDLTSGKQIGQPITADYYFYTGGGRYLAAVSYYGGGIRLIDTSTGNPVGESIENEEYLGQGSGDDEIITRDGSSLYLWSAEDFHKETLPINIQEFYDFRISKNGRYMAVEYYDGRITFWDLASGEVQGEAENLPGYINEFSPYGRFFTVYDYNEGKFVLYDIETLENFPSEEPIIGDSFLFSKNDEFAIVINYYSPGNDVYDLSNGEKLNVSPITGQILGFSGDGKWLVSLDGDQIKLNSMRNWSTPATTIEYDGLYKGNALSEDGNTLVVYGNHGADLYDLSSPNPENLEITFSNPASMLRNMWFSDGGVLATLGNDGLALWDVNKQERIGEKLLTSESSYIADIRFSPDGKTIAYRDMQGNVYLIEINAVANDEEELATVNPDYRDTCAIGFDDENNLIVTKQFSGKILLYGVHGSTEGLDLELKGGCFSVMTFSADGSSFAYADGDRIQVYSLSDQGESFRKQTNIVTGDSIFYLDFIDDKTLAVGGYYSLSLWDVDTRTQLLVTTQSSRAFYVTPGVILFDLANEGHVVTLDINSQVWEEKLSQWKIELCTKVRRNFTLSEWNQYFPGLNYPEQQDALTCPEWESGNVINEETIVTP